MELTRAVVSAFPTYQPYGGQFAEIVPHLTVAQGSAQRAEAAAPLLRERLARHGRVETFANEVQLIENSSEQWRVRHAFRLSAGDS